MIIKENYINKNGCIFSNVKEIAFEKENLFGNLGKYITESSLKEDDDIGVYIYQDYKNPNIAYRIYKQFAEYNFNGYSDDKLIEKLQLSQKNITKTLFPTGVVTLDRRIIGQEIPFYCNSVTILEYIKNSKDIDPISTYIQILDILKELLENDIVYLDVHSRNFVIDLITKKINLIDFDYYYMRFDKYIKIQIENYRKMINYLNEILNITNIVGYLKNEENYEQCLYSLEEMYHKLMLKY